MAALRGAKQARLPSAPGGRRGEILFRAASLGAALCVLVTVAGILVAMAYGGWPALKAFGPGFLTSSAWEIGREQFGAWPALIGTLTTSLIALGIGVPIGLGIAIFLTELSPPVLKRPIATAIELLAAVPSIVFGMWGLFALAPLFARFVQVPVSALVEGMPILGMVLYARVPSGVGVLTAGIILGIMIVPLIASIARDILEQIPPVLREGAYGVGCTTWEVVRSVLIPQAGVSLLGAVMLGLGRALGETMAVTFVIGNANRLSPSIFDPGSTIASRIASEFNEADGLQLNALLALGCTLFLLTFAALAVARLLIARVQRQ